MADRFPILLDDWKDEFWKDCPRSVPWEIVKHAERQAEANHGQTLTRLAQRGGLCPRELRAVIFSKSFWDVTLTDEELLAWVKRIT